MICDTPVPGKPPIKSIAQYIKLPREERKVMEFNVSSQASQRYVPRVFLDWCRSVFFIPVICRSLVWRCLWLAGTSHRTLSASSVVQSWAQLPK